MRIVEYAPPLRAVLPKSGVPKAPMVAESPTASSLPTDAISRRKMSIDGVVSLSM